MRVEAPDRAVVTVSVLLLVVALETVMVALTTVVPPMVAVPEPLMVRLSYVVAITAWLEPV